MKCPKCGNKFNNKVVDSRPTENLMRRNRRYECPQCKEDHGEDDTSLYRFSTIEVYVDERIPDADLVEEIRELKVVINFLFNSIFRTKPTLDSRVIWDKVQSASDEMIIRIRQYVNKDFGKE